MLLALLWGCAMGLAEPAPTTRPQPPRMAEPQDLRIGVLVDPAQHGTDREMVIVAYLMNRSKEDIRVFLPGFVGPILGAPTNRPAAASAPLELRSTPKYTDADFVVLPPAGMVGRGFSVRPDWEPKALAAHYAIYAPGQEGKQDAIRFVVYMDGRVDRVRPKGGPVETAR